MREALTEFLWGALGILLVFVALFFIIPLVYFLTVVAWETWAWMLR